MGSSKELVALLSKRSLDKSMRLCHEWQAPCAQVVAVDLIFKHFVQLILFWYENF